MQLWLTSGFVEGETFDTVLFGLEGSIPTVADADPVEVGCAIVGGGGEFADEGGAKGGGRLLHSFGPDVAGEVYLGCSAEAD